MSDRRWFELVEPCARLLGFAVVAERFGHVLQLEHRAFDPFGKRRGGGDIGGQLFKRVGGGRGQLGGGVAAGKRIVGGVRQQGDLLGVDEAAAFFQQRVLLTLFYVCGGQLGRLEGEDFGARGAVLFAFAKRFIALLFLYVFGARRRRIRRGRFRFRRIRRASKAAPAPSGWIGYPAGRGR